MMLETTDHSDVAGSLLDDSGYTEMLQKRNHQSLRVGSRI